MENRGCLVRYRDDPKEYKRIKAKEYYWRNRKKVLEYWKNRFSHLEERRKASREWYYKNREKAKRRIRKWVVNNKDKVKVYRNTYFNKHIQRMKLYRKVKNLRCRKLKKYPDSFGKMRDYKSWIEFLKTTPEICLSCGATKDITVDHVVPLSIGGKHEISNVQLLCRICNTKKGIKIIDYRETKEA